MSDVLIAVAIVGAAVCFIGLAYSMYSARPYKVCPYAKKCGERMTRGEFYRLCCNKVGILCSHTDCPLFKSFQRKENSETAKKWLAEKERTEVT